MERRSGLIVGRRRQDHESRCGRQNLGATDQAGTLCETDFQGSTLCARRFSSNGSPNARLRVFPPVGSYAPGCTGKIAQSRPGVNRECKQGATWGRETSGERFYFRTNWLPEQDSSNQLPTLCEIGKEIISAGSQPALGVLRERQLINKTSGVCSGGRKRFNCRRARFHPYLVTTQRRG